MLISVKFNERSLQNINSYRNRGACTPKYFLNEFFTAVSFRMKLIIDYYKCNSGYAETRFLCILSETQRRNFLFFSGVTKYVIQFYIIQCVHHDVYRLF